MPDGRIALSYLGPQDLYLTNDPQVSYFRCVYKRPSQFTIETRREVFGNDGYGRMSKCRLTKNAGDLIKNISLSVSLDECVYDNKKKKYCNEEDADSDTVANCDCADCVSNIGNNILKFGWVNSIGYSLIESYWIEFNGRQIDKQYGEWLEIWTELALTIDKRNTLYEMIGKVDPATFTVDSFPLNRPHELIIPLNLWFCRFVSLALPIISMSRTDVDIVFNFREFNSLWVTNKADEYPREKPPLRVSLLVDYIFLAEEERKIFFNENQIYLIDQLQMIENSFSAGSKNINMNIKFNHPVKELVWIMQRNDVTNNPISFNPPITENGYPLGNDWFNFTPEITRKKLKRLESFESANLNVDGVDLFNRLPAIYFRLYHPYLYHTKSANNNIYNYSFSLKTEDLTPTGTLNIGETDNARLNIYINKKKCKFHHDNISTASSISVRVYAVNYNILSVIKGNADVQFR